MQTVSKYSPIALRVMSRKSLITRIKQLYQVVSIFENAQEEARDERVNLSLGLVTFESAERFFFTYVLSNAHAKERMDAVRAKTGQPVHGFAVLFECNDEVAKIRESYGAVWTSGNELGFRLEPFLNGYGGA